MNVARQRARAEDVSGNQERFDVAVIGGGQAGLAIGYFLARPGQRFEILEAADSIGAVWRTRWNSLVLFTPRLYSALPGLPFPGDSDGYPTRDEVLAYLERYAETFKRPFQVPRIPAVAGELSPEVLQIHSTGYMQPSAVPPGIVLVVGGGNTGYQIAKELSATHRVYLAVGSRQTPLPQRFLGRDLFWWLTKTGLIKKTVETRIGQRLQHRDTLIGSSPRDVRRHGVALKQRVTAASGRVVTFADGSALEVDAVIWAAGYRSDYSWIDAPIIDSTGRVKHRRGVTDVPGLYFLGLTWQHTRGSALIGWVKDDAEFIAEQIEASPIGHESERGTRERETLRAMRATPAS